MDLWALQKANEVPTLHWRMRNEKTSGEHEALRQ
jgi:hypothetical protein